MLATVKVARLFEVSQYFGHSNPTITAQIYTHLTQGGLEKARGIQDAISSGVASYKDLDGS